MATNGHNAGRKLGGKVKFPGISADADAIGISASYLWLCLTGRRKADHIVAEYWKLKKRQTENFLRQIPKST